MEAPAFSFKVFAEKRPRCFVFVLSLFVDKHRPDHSDPIPFEFYTKDVHYLDVMECSRHLSVAVRAIRYLDVIVGIPVRVVNEHSVCSGQVDTKASRASGQQETKRLCPRSCEEPITCLNTL